MHGNRAVVPREYELVNTRSSAAVAHVIVDEPTAISVYPVSRRRCRKSCIALLVAVGIIVIVGVIFFTGGSHDSSNLSTGLSSNNTPAETTVPTIAPATSAPTLSFINDNKCLGDRIQNRVKLNTGHFICDHYGRFRFGMDDTGAFLYADDDSNATTILFQGQVGSYFEMLETAEFVVYNNKTGIKQWSRECSEKVHLSEQCHDCPYLHLHSDGVIVLNYIASNGGGEWKERNIKHLYDVDF